MKKQNNSLRGMGYTPTSAAEISHPHRKKRLPAQRPTIPLEHGTQNQFPLFRSVMERFAGSTASGYCPLAHLRLFLHGLRMSRLELHPAPGGVEVGAGEDDHRPAAGGHAVKDLVRDHGSDLPVPAMDEAPARKVRSYRPYCF